MYQAVKLKKINSIFITHIPLCIFKTFKKSSERGLYKMRHLDCMERDKPFIKLVHVLEYCEYIQIE